VTYDKNVDFGITACRRSVPQVQRLIDYMEVSLAELEDAAGLSKAKPKTKAKPRKKRAPVKKKAK
jgi:diacylglycerol O-acyltransferase